MSAQKEISVISTNSENEKEKEKKKKKKGKEWPWADRVLMLYGSLIKGRVIGMGQFCLDMDVKEQTVENDVYLINQFLKQETQLNKIAVIEGTKIAGRKIRLVNSKSSIQSKNKKNQKDYSKKQPFRILRFKKEIEKTKKIHFEQWAKKTKVSRKTAYRDANVLDIYYLYNEMEKELKIYSNIYCKLIIT